MKPLVSVVTPFYNTQDYLAECIESVLHQTYTNWEYVLVNNCSTDRSLAIAEYYADKDSRIRIVNNEAFLTQVQNYNHALRHISIHSDYCKILQADDWIFPNCISEMAALAEMHNNVGVIGAYSLLGSKVYLDGLPYPSTVTSGKAIRRLLLTKGLYVFGTPTSLLIRSGIIRGRDPFYDEGSPVEDAEVFLDLLQHWDFGFVHQVLTYSRRENESLVSAINTYDPLTLLRFIGTYKYGTHCFTEQEYRSQLRSITKEYHSFLGESMLRRRPKAFWDFHKKGWVSAGLVISQSTLYRYAFLAFLHYVLNPKDTLQRMYRRLLTTFGS